MVEIQKALALESHYGVAHELLAQIYVEKGMYEEAIDNARLALEEMGNDSTRSALLAYVYAKAGRVAEARGILQQLLSAKDQASFPTRGLASIYIGLR